MGCSSKAFKEPCALLHQKVFPFSSLCASSPSRCTKCCLLSSPLSLLSLSPPQGLTALVRSGRPVAPLFKVLLAPCTVPHAYRILVIVLLLHQLAHCSCCSFVMQNRLNCGLHSPPLPCCSASCTPSLSGDLGRFASSCCPSSDSLRSRFEGKLKQC